MSNKLWVKLSAVLSVSALASNAFALQEWDLKPPGGGNWDWTYITENNFAQSWDGADSNGNKYLQFQGIVSSSNGHCLELETTPRNTVNPDTRIWVYDGSNYLSVNDDYNGTNQSKARFWLSTTGSLDFVIHVQAFNNSWNSMDFGLKVTRRDITEAACTTSSGLPWAKMSGTGYGTVTRGNWT
jgi:hypothetical protein